MAERNLASCGFVKALSQPAADKNTHHRTLGAGSRISILLSLPIVTQLVPGETTGCAIGAFPPLDPGSSQKVREGNHLDLDSHHIFHPLNQISLLSEFKI